MTHRDRIARIYAGEAADRPGFWLGNPHEETLAKLLAHFNVGADEEIRRLVGDDCRWCASDWGAYKHPEGRPPFDYTYQKDAKISFESPGTFSECESVAEVEAYPWPDPAYLDFSELRQRCAGLEDYWRFGGAWCSFFHDVAAFFGMENYFVKMYTDPEVVHAVTRHVVDYYLAANHKLFSEEGDLVDAFFFGNDFGSQEDLLVSPEKFKEFILPYFRELIAQAKSFGKPTQLHSCGSIIKVIPWLIDAGIDALHPLQARAKGMDAVRLAREFKGQITFVGGVDTQELLWRGTPQQVKDEVARLHEIFGGRWIVSPSHEMLLPEVPLENILALCAAATGLSCV